MLADVRRFPGSRNYPHFGKDALEKHLLSEEIHYKHFEALGGRRKPLKDSENYIWKNTSFRGYADYMQTDEFKRAVDELLSANNQKHTAIMCSEAVWWRCHRSMISDYLKSIGIEVFHILSDTKTEIHPYTKPAKIIGGKLSYKSESGLFD